MDATVELLIDELTTTLAGPIDDPEWTAETAIAWRMHLLGLRRVLERGETPHGDQYHLTKWIAFDGAHNGPIAARFATLQARLNELYAEEEWWFTAHAVVPG